MSKTNKIPKGSAAVAIMGVAVLVDEATVARLVQDDALFLRPNCPCYHINEKLMRPLIFGGSVLDLRPVVENLPEDTELAAKLAAFGKGAAS